MTQSALTPTPEYLIQGTGPYAITHGYSAKADILAAVILDNTRADLVLDTDFFVSPDSSDTGGDVTLSAAAAALYNTGRLYISRATVADQGWQGTNGAREAGLEAQLDKLAQGLQDVQRDLARAMRLDYALGVLALKPNSLVAVDENKQIYAEDPNILAQLTPDFAQTQAYIDGLIDTRVPIDGTLSEIDQVKAQKSIGVSFLKNMHTLAVTSGTPPNFTLTSPEPVSALVAGMVWYPRFHDALGAPNPDISIDGLPAVPLKTFDKFGSKMTARTGAVQAGQFSPIIFDGADMIILSPCATVDLPGPVKVFSDPTLASRHDSWPPSQFDLWANSLGGKTPVDVSQARSVGVEYTNTDPGPRRVEVLVTASIGEVMLERIAPSMVTDVADLKASGVARGHLSAWIPPNWKYRLVSGTIEQWSEWG